MLSFSDGEEIDLGIMSGDEEVSAVTSDGESTKQGGDGSLSDDGPEEVEVKMFYFEKKK